MDSTMDVLIKRAYATPSLRANIVNKGKIYIYCDYSGYSEQNAHGVACCYVYNRKISVTSKQLQIESDRGSNYGELLAIVYSIEILTKALQESHENHNPKFAILLTDCNCIAKILSRKSLHKQSYERVINDILSSLNDFQIRFPEIRIIVKYISKHKKNNALHRMAHNAARKAIGR